MSHGLAFRNMLTVLGCLLFVSFLLATPFLTAFSLCCEWPPIISILLIIASLGELGVVTVLFSQSNII